MATYLIVNADDYGYFRSVSRGILKGADAGVISAAGIMANSPAFDELVPQLLEHPNLDAGVHLNLTYGDPVSRAMTNAVGAANGFPPKYSLVKGLISGDIDRHMVLLEWRAQIQKCLDAGLKLRFLNSHEHIHMFPALFTLLSGLASEYEIRHIRCTLPEWQWPLTMGATVRNLLMAGMSRINHNVRRSTMSGFLGLAQSGNITMDYLRSRLPRLKAGGVYELMCHPGYFDPDEINDKNLLEYHKWESELNTLLGPEFGELCQANGVQIIGYRDLDTNPGVG